MIRAWMLSSSSFCYADWKSEMNRATIARDKKNRTFKSLDSFPFSLSKSGFHDLVNIQIRLRSAEMFWASESPHLNQD
jgi:hypothetical protein